MIVEVWVRVAVTTLAMACACFVLGSVAAAKGGGHGGGHSGGHGSGHSRGASHSSGAKSSPRAATASSTSPHRTGTSGPQARPRNGVGQPDTTAIPRSPASPLVPPSLSGGTGLLPSRPLFGTSGSLGFALFSTPGWPVVPVNVDAIPSGGLRLEVEPATAQVFVDGVYAGIVDDYNGRSRHLDLEAGPHHLEIRRTGYDPIVVDVVIQAHYTISYRGALVPSTR